MPWDILLGSSLAENVGAHCKKLNVDAKQLFLRGENAKKAMMADHICGKRCNVFELMASTDSARFK